MVSDSEPRYRLVDSNGNIVGSLFAEADGTLALQEGTSGSDNEITVQSDGTFTAPAVNTVDLDIGGSDAFDSGDFVAWGPCVNVVSKESTTSTSYVATNTQLRCSWESWAPANAQTAFVALGRLINSSGDIRLQNINDGETLFEATNIQGDSEQGPTNYTPTTTNSPVTFRLEFRTNDGGTSTSIAKGAFYQFGVQV